VFDVDDDDPNISEKEREREKGEMKGGGLMKMKMRVRVIQKTTERKDEEEEEDEITTRLRKKERRRKMKEGNKTLDLAPGLELRLALLQELEELVVEGGIIAHLQLCADNRRVEKIGMGKETRKVPRKLVVPLLDLLWIDEVL